ncbi:MAG: DUF3231 family protein [Clostridiaceae bacterium]|nr:DUF3231 family protein [Clostridiaceae bacterium]
MQDITKMPLVSSEITGLWNSYMGDSISICVLKYFANRVQDTETHAILQYTLDLCKKHINEITNLFYQLHLPIPAGFSDGDVDMNAPRLFTDEFYLLYLSNMARTEMLSYNQILSNCVQSDIRNYFAKLIIESSNLYNAVVDIRSSKGIFTMFPQVEVIRNIDYIKEYIKGKDFLVDWFGEKRSLLACEITHISLVILANIVGMTLTTGFGRVSTTKEIGEYMVKGRELALKKIDIFTTILISENIPIPSTSYSYVSDSITAPFSEKLMMFHIASLGTSFISNDGMALAESLRSDLHTTYIQIATEAMIYSKAGADILIDNGWFEQPPEGIKHEN